MRLDPPGAHPQCKGMTDVPLPSDTDRRSGSDDLTGQYLIAMPDMGDPRFDRAVIYLCAHSSDGAMGLILNKPAPELPLRGLLEQIGITPTDAMPEMPVHFGGPVENGRGFVLHSRDYQTGNDTTLEVAEHVGMTATMDILEDIAQGKGPDHCLLALGYAGWGPGQLERELQENGWLTTPGPDTLIFAPEPDRKWEAALAVMGINPLMLSSTGGSA